MAIEKNTGPRDHMRRRQHGVPDAGPVGGVDAALLERAECVLGDDNARVDEHADGDGDPGEAHDVRGDAGVVHPQKRRQHRERQRQRDDQDPAQVHQEDDVRKRDEEDLL